MKFLVYILFFAISSVCFGQQNDSLRIAFKKDSIAQKKAVRKAIYGNARKATIMSAVFPGLGQIYNRKYWKAPVIYAALGGLGYWAATNQTKLKYYSTNLAALHDEDESTINETLYSSDQLVTLKRDARKYRDIAFMCGALVYLVNIIDANVDAHLKTFDISDDLSLRISPYSNLDYHQKLQTGLTFRLTFK